MMRPDDWLNVRRWIGSPVPLRPPGRGPGSPPPVVALFPLTAIMFTQLRDGLGIKVDDAGVVASWRRLDHVVADGDERLTDAQSRLGDVA